jgi:signal transduction histidine kinase
MAFILKEMEMEADAVEALEILSRSSEHLRTLIMNLLDFSKFEAKGEELNERDCSLFKLLGDVREMCKTNLKEGVAYEHDIADDVPDRIKLDDIKLKQVLINLVGNAVKFTSSGYVKNKQALNQKTASTTCSSGFTTPASASPKKSWQHCSIRFRKSMKAISEISAAPGWVCTSP